MGKQTVVRRNPKSDRFTVKRFHHVEFWCSDATNVARGFSWALGMPIVAKSDLSTGNMTHASYLLRSDQINFLFTAPYSPSIAAAQNLSTTATASIPTFDYAACNSFAASHGLGVRSIAIEVDDAHLAYSTSVQNGARPSSPPLVLDNQAVLAEVKLYGDVLLRYISYEENPTDGFFLPGFKPVDETSSYPSVDFGIRRIDHAVGCAPELGPVVEYMKGFTGFHDFAEFTAEDVGATSESAMNSVVMASNDETVLLVVSEPVSGTKRKSPIQNFLEHNDGPGVHHLALSTQDIFTTLREMKQRTGFGGFEFMPPPPPTYYRKLKNRVGDVLTDDQIKKCEDFGIMVDRDDQGTVLQIFTKPVGDRPTIFIEIIQRIGCMVKDSDGNLYQKGGCGGFGKGNIAELFKSVEEYAKTLEAYQPPVA